MRFGVHDRPAPDTALPAARVVGSGPPICHLCGERFAVPAGTDLETAWHCPLCRRIIYIMDRLSEALTR